MGSSLISGGDLAEERVADAVVESVEIGINPDAGFGRERLQHDVEAVVDERGR